MSIKEIPERWEMSSSRLIRAEDEDFPKILGFLRGDI